MNELALFAGAGGGILGSDLLGWRTICAVEIDAYCRSVLLRRQADGLLPKFPIWDDVCTFDGLPWRGQVDVVSGGFPCQDISTAGKGAGIDGERSGLWGEMARVIREVQPQYVFVENSATLAVRGLGRVLGDLAEMGFDAEWGVLGAYHAGAPHGRERLWILAHSTDGVRWPKPGRMGRSKGAGRREAQERSVQERLRQPRHDGPAARCSDAEQCNWTVEPPLDRMVDGMANWVEQHRAIGNGQVPAVVKVAWETLSRDNA